MSATWGEVHVGTYSRNSSFHLGFSVFFLILVCRAYLKYCSFTYGSDSPVHQTKKLVRVSLKTSA